MLVVDSPQRRLAVARAALHETRPQIATALGVSVSEVDNLLTRTARQNRQARQELIRSVLVTFLAEHGIADPHQALTAFLHPGSAVGGQTKGRFWGCELV